MQDDRLQRLLGGPECAQLRLKLRARFERGTLVDDFSLTGLTASERAVLEGLLGRAPRQAESIRLSHQELDHAVRRAGLADNLRQALELLEGRIVNRRAEQARIEEGWTAVLAGLHDVRLRAMLSEPSGVALLKRCAGGEPERGTDLLERAARVLMRLPAHGISRAQLSAEVLGDAHALDAGQPVAALVLRACRAVANVQGESTAASRALQQPSIEDLAADPEGEEELDLSIRSQWATVGVAVNELSAPVLLLNIAASGNLSSDEIVRAALRDAQPLHLSLRTLLRSAPTWDVANVVVSVCENPSIVAAAADRLRTNCRPLLCTDGMPGAAQQLLMHQLVKAGAILRYHGDFDWAGVRIGNFLMSQCRAMPWRFGAEDYMATTDFIGRTLGPDARLEASWDPALAGVMIARGREVHEEQLFEILLEDLRSTL
jgi:uncharacterized protein (TIGR02679 family)